MQSFQNIHSGIRNPREVLTEDQLRRNAPSIFTAHGSETTSDRYTSIPTYEVVQGLSKEGFMPVYAFQSRSRVPGKKDYVKHTLRFRHVNALQSNNGSTPELVLINSHDGTSSYKLMAGLYRIVCANGLISGETYNQIKVRHQGDIVGKVIEGSYEVIDQGQKMLEASEEMSSIQLTHDEKLIFAEAVHSLRFAEDDENREVIKPEQFLNLRRTADRNDDLYTTFNVAQENLIKGGLKGWKRAEDGTHHKVTTREVRSIDKSTALNRAIWTLAEKMAELKR